ncbi:hypothetical protein [Marinibactrum halimedae]|uniref:Uncharacterized protein n=1 Tax=Marinibactrum halimedae TaxID=1444977 RepID=A0AA37T518_9GAMM|nr:hypothetical protein [Marinibactrum halimedae]MCD9459236.1 hypothetical protein [Marinibactrum halimedae]GLS27308.1 hypothetical protein GCM10007877_30270 [Marinibactrum halimedae]
MDDTNFDVDKLIQSMKMSHGIPNTPYKEGTGAITEALTYFEPQYMMWDSIQQERHRLSLSQEEQSRLLPIIIARLFHRECNADNVTEVYNTLSPEEVSYLNQCIAFALGYGESKMALLSPALPENQSLMDFETVYDADNAIFEHADSEQEVKKPYIPLEQSINTNAFIQGSMDNTQLCTAARYMADVIKCHGDGVVEELIPHRLVTLEGDDFLNVDLDSAVGNPFVALELFTDAKGLETPLGELQRFASDYAEERFHVLSKTFEEQLPAVHLFISGEEYGHQKVTVFRNTESLKKVRWYHFMEDAGSLSSNPEAFFEHINQEIELATSVIQKKHKEVMKTFYRLQRRNRWPERSITKLASEPPSSSTHH